MIGGQAYEKAAKKNIAARLLQDDFTKKSRS